MSRKNPEILDYVPIPPPQPHDPATWPAVIFLLFWSFLAIVWALAAPSFTPPGPALSFQHDVLALIVCLIVQALGLRSFRQSATPRRVGLLVVMLLCLLFEASLTMVVINFCRGDHRVPLIDW